MDKETLLEVRDLHAGVGAVKILKGVNLLVRAGEVHAIMGPNGSGKSTLAYVLAGHPGYTVTQGQVKFRGQDLLAMAPDQRARAGFFLSFQQPVEIPGVRMDQFLRASVNAMRKGRGLPELDVLKFDRFLTEKAKVVALEPAFIRRNVNEGFSGGEKKRAEVLQLAALEPKLAVLDECDSGLDVDALREVAQGIDRLRSPETSLVLVTHYQRVLGYVIPDFVHVLVDGRIVASAGKELAQEVEANGYDRFEEIAGVVRTSAGRKS